MVVPQRPSCGASACRRISVTRLCQVQTSCEHAKMRFGVQLPLFEEDVEHSMP